MFPSSAAAVTAAVATDPIAAANHELVCKLDIAVGNG